MFKIITRTVWVLSFVSMFADIASEMLYPIVPVYLREIGFSVFLIGLLEGLAELTVGLSKGYFGKLSDERGKRLPFVKLGYLFSAISKPMMALFIYPLWIFFARTTDRLGKGLRTASRDALLSQEATPETRARVFTFHRGWDTVGAVLGPLIALLFLHFYPARYKSLFYIAFLPGLASVALIFLLKEKKRPPGNRPTGNFFSFFSFWKRAPQAYRQVAAGLVFFAIANSSDVFLLLRAKEISGHDSMTISAYIFYNLVYALSSFPMGILADRIGMKKVFLGGLFLFAAVYTGFAFLTAPAGIYILFLLYGLYAAATEGIAKAWISNTVPSMHTATAIGLYASLQSICGFTASLIAGLLWKLTGSMVVFCFSAMLTLLVITYMSRLRAVHEA